MLVVDWSLDFITYIFICGGVKMSTALLSVIAIIIIECLIIAYLIHYHGFFFVFQLRGEIMGQFLFYSALLGAMWYLILWED